MKDHINVNGHGGTFSAYIARPKSVPAPAVVVLQELFGVNADIRKHCDELAEQGYLAVAPDLYWRQEPGVDLNVTSEADWDHGLRLYSAYDRDAGVRDIKGHYRRSTQSPGMQRQGCLARLLPRRADGLHDSCAQRRHRRCGLVSRRRY